VGFTWDLRGIYCCIENMCGRQQGVLRHGLLSNLPLAKVQRSLENTQVQTPRPVPIKPEILEAVTGDPVVAKFHARRIQV